MQSFVFFSLKIKSPYGSKIVRNYPHTHLHQYSVVFTHSFTHSSVKKSASSVKKGIIFFFKKKRMYYRVKL